MSFDGFDPAAVALLDRLPDMIDDDADALRVFDVLHAGLQALRESDSLEDTEIGRALVRLRGRVQTLVGTLSGSS